MPLLKRTKLFKERGLKVREMVEVGCTLQLGHAFQNEITNKAGAFDDDSFMYILLDGHVSEWEHLSTEEILPTLKAYRKEVEREYRHFDSQGLKTTVFDLLDEPLDFETFQRVRRATE